MRIALPVWGNKVSPVLDTASRLLVVDTFDRKKVSRTETVLEELDISRRCLRIGKLNVDVLICGAVSRAFDGLLKASGVRTLQGISGEIEDVLEAFFNGNLYQSRFLMPGCRGHDMPAFATPPDKSDTEERK